MPTFLTTSRMSPPLRARIEASVAGQGRSSGAKLKPRSTMLLRAVALLLIVSSASWLALAKRRSDQDLEQARARLLERWRGQAALVTDRDRALDARVRPWLLQAGTSYGGDWIAPSLKGPAALSRTLARPIVYVRGPLEQFRSSKAMQAMALNSVKDPFVYCLVSPPEKRDEKQLLSRVRSVYRAGERARKATSHIAPLGDALVGLPLLAPAWAARVAAAEHVRDLEALERTLERAPLAGARQAAKANLLLVATDEPGEPSVPAELDGERPHRVRVLLVDLDSNKPLLRLRRMVDPSWLSDATRSEYAYGVDSCSLAMEIRQAIAGD